MIYNHRHWFPKGNLKLEHSFTGGNSAAIYDMCTNNTDLFFAQEDAVRKFVTGTKTASSIYAAKSYKIEYAHGESYYLKFVVSLFSYQFNGTSVAGPGSYPSPEISARHGIANSYFSSICKSDYSITAKISNYNNVQAETWDLYFINSMCSVGSDCYFTGNTYGFLNRFRKYSDAANNLSYPSTDLYLPVLIPNADNTKIYGLEGSYNNWIGGSTLYIYTIANNTWATVALPANYAGFKPVFYNGSLYITAYNTATGRAVLLKFDGTSSFEIIKGISDCKLYCGEVLNGVLYIGGSDGKLYSYTA